VLAQQGAAVVGVGSVAVVAVAVVVPAVVTVVAALTAMAAPAAIATLRQTGTNYSRPYSAGSVEGGAGPCPWGRVDPRVLIDSVAAVTVVAAVVAAVEAAMVAAALVKRVVQISDWET